MGDDHNAGELEPSAQLRLILERIENLCERVDSLQYEVRELRKADRMLQVSQSKALEQGADGRDALDARLVVMDARVRALELRPEPKDQLVGAKRKVLLGLAALLVAAAAALGGGAVGGLVRERIDTAAAVDGEAP